MEIKSFTIATATRSSFCFGTLWGLLMMLGVACGDGGGDVAEEDGTEEAADLWAVEPKPVQTRSARSIDENSAAGAAAPTLRGVDPAEVGARSEAEQASSVEVESAEQDLLASGFSPCVFPWGFYIAISHQELVSFFGGARSAVEIEDRIRATHRLPPAVRPFVTVVAACLWAGIADLRRIDRGRGVHISMSWFAPGMCIPTPV